MEITFTDCVLTPTSEDSIFYDLRFYKKVKDRETGEFKTELGSPLYGLTLNGALRRIASYRTNKKYKEQVVELKTYVQDLRSEIKQLREYLYEEKPEKFDTGE